MEEQWRCDHEALLVEKYSLDVGEAVQCFTSQALTSEEAEVEDGSGMVDAMDDYGDASESESSVPGPDQPLTSEDRELYQSLMRMHINTGHRSVKRFCRALALAGAPRSTLKTVRRLKCSICQEKRRVKSRRPSALPRARAFGMLYMLIWSRFQISPA